MASLDLFSKRQPHSVTLESHTESGKPHEYLIPTEYTLEETELLLQQQANVDLIAKRKAKKGKEDEDLLQFFEAILVQLLILFKRYQPEMVIDDLKRILTKEEGMAMWAFFIKERTGFVDEVKKPAKKKVLKSN